MLSVKLFGNGQAAFFDHPLPGYPNQIACLLLSYLLMNKQRPHNRERLAAVFWEDQPAHVARKNLRNTLWRLRQILLIAGANPDDYLHLSDESVSFQANAPCWIDVDAFESASRWIHLPEQSLTPDQAAQLEAAVDLYQGDFLENTYEDWCLYDRERLRLMYIEMLSRLVVYYGARGDYPHGLGLGQRLLAYDHSREDIHRQMIWMYWRTGDRSAALTQYKLCSQVLREEVGVEPTEATRHLYEQVLRTQAPSLPPPAESAASTQNTGEIPPLAQNALQQLQRLQQVLEQTNAELIQIERMIYQTLANSK